MKPEEAFDIVVKVTGDFKGNRQDHALITQALEVLSSLIPKEDPE